MQLENHVAQVTNQLAAAAALGDERTREIAAALSGAAAPAVRLALLAALAEAADEITAVLLDLPGSPAVSVRLDGDEALVDVRLAEPAPAVDESRERPRDDGDTSARISLRLAESLKADVDAAAARDGVSVNTWLVRAATAALGPNPFDALAGFARHAGNRGGGWSGGWGGGAGRPAGGRPGHGGNQRVTGWING